MLLVYADHDTVPPAQSQEQLTKIHIKDLEPSNTDRTQSKFSANGKGMISTFTNLVRRYTILVFDQATEANSVWPSHGGSG